MNILKNTKVYLVGAIQNDPNGSSWRKNITEKLKEINVICFDPYIKPFVTERSETPEMHEKLLSWMKKKDFCKVSDHMKLIRSEDLRLVDVADFVIIYIDPKVPSWGSAEEFFWANRLKKPIFVVIEGGKKQTPLWLMGTIPHHYIYDSFEDVLQTLYDINFGKIQIDSNRWKLLKMEYR